jgi:hypothetical protein
VKAAGGGGAGEGDALAAGFCVGEAFSKRSSGILLRREPHLSVRRAVVVLQERYRASERQVCRVVGQHRSTQRHRGKVVDLEEAKLRHRLREIAADHIRWGRRMAYRLLRREEGLQRPTPRKQKRARPADGSVRRHRVEYPHQVWAMDFQFDATADGRRLKFLNVIDEYSRLCMAIRSDNGPEFNRCAEAWRLRPGSTELVRGQWDHHGLHRAGIPVGERLC